MNKLFSIIIPVALLTTAVNAQEAGNKNTGASQTAHLVLTNAIDISFMSSGSSVSEEAVMDFRGVNDFVNGVTTHEQELKVRSNGNFTVAVKCAGSSFSYQGQGNPNMPESALKVKVTKNNTGGAVKAPFSTTNYTALSNTNQDILVDGHNGNDQTFAVQYKCTPGYSLPAGTYTMNVVYTATQQ